MEPEKLLAELNATIDRGEQLLRDMRSQEKTLAHSLRDLDGKIKTLAEARVDDLVAPLVEDALATCEKGFRGRKTAPDLRRIMQMEETMQSLETLGVLPPVDKP